METVSCKWLSERDMEDPTFSSQYQMVNINPIDYTFNDFSFQSFSSERYSSYPNINQKISSHTNGSSIEASHHHPQIDDDDDFKWSMKQLKNNNWNSCITQNMPPKASSSSSSHIISFDNSNSSPKIEVSKKVGSLTRTPLRARDHVIAERKRREKVSQRFISLSALIPGLKKMDKASIIGDAIKYLKQLQDRVTTLEEQVARKEVESVIFVRKTQIYADDRETSNSFDDQNLDFQSNKSFPDIEARVSDKDVLIKIHCEKNKGCISNIINELEKLHLLVLNSNFLHFGQSTLDITIVAQMEAEFSMTTKDLVKSLRLALMKPM